MSTTLTSHRRPVDVARRIPVAAPFVVAALEAAPMRVIGARLRLVWTGPGVARDVRVGVGPLLEDEDALVLPVWWEEAEHPWLFPTFDGGLELRSDGDGTDLRLIGSYEPPLGSVGRFADGLAGHRLVVASLEALLDDIASRLLEAATDGWLERR